MSPVFRTVIFTILVPGCWTVLLPWWLARRAHVRLHFDVIATLGGLLAFCGVALYLLCAFWDSPCVVEALRPLLIRPKKLVVVGPYAVVRNPMYWAVLFVMLGEAAILRFALLAQLAVLFFLASCAFVLFYEEPTLRAGFGAEYEEYCRRVPRWFPNWKVK